MRRGAYFFGMLAWAGMFACAFALFAQQAPSSPVVWRIPFENEAITPVSARFLDQAITQAEQANAQAAIVVLDTPGGLLDSTRAMVMRILESRIPIVVYVGPPGARAASAGVFITLSAHFAAMAPGTNIGAAHPVSVGGLPGQNEPAEPSPRETEPSKPPPEDKPASGEKSEAPPPATAPSEVKAVEDAAAWARALAELRGRNVEWADRAVRESVAVPASEAVKLNVVDFMAADFDELLERLDGRAYTTPYGAGTLHTKGARVQTREMWWGERVLSVLANPTVAVILLTLGFYGLLFELYTAGWGISGTLGAISLVLGFFALAVLPVNLAGIALILAALAMFAAEPFVASHGLLTLGGIACMVLGGVMLVDSPPGFEGVSLWALAPLTLATAGISAFLLSRILRARRFPPLMGAESLASWPAFATETFHPEGERYQGLVRTHGELWKAISPAPVAENQQVRIVGRDGLTLQVQADSNERNES